jgi:hypothetical protein
MAVPDLRMSADRRQQISARLHSGAKLTAESEFLESSFQQLIAARQAAFPKRLEADVLGHQRVKEADQQGLFVLDLVLPSLGRRTALEADCLARLRLG